MSLADIIGGVGRLTKAFNLMEERAARQGKNFAPSAPAVKTFKRRSAP